MDIYFKDTDLTPSLVVDVNDNSYRHRAIKGEHSLTLYFSLPEHVEIPVGAYCVFEAETYTLEAPENFKMHNSRNFEYTVVFESSQAKLRKYKFRNLVDNRLKFDNYEKPHRHLELLIDNLNKRDSGWSAGECVDAVAKNIAFNHTYCMDALSQMAEAFETEWEIVGKTIHLHKVEYNKANPLPLSYGRGNGFKPGVGRTNFSDSKPVEVLFVQGGEKNIDASKYKSKELLLPKNATLGYDGKFFEGQSGFNASVARTYVSDADGLSIRRQDKPLRSKEEDSLDLSHVYPSRVGEVTKVEVTKEGFCDFFDTTIPENLDYSLPESRFAGEMMTVIFQSGMLAGKEFEIQQNGARVYGYVHSERRFQVKEQTIDGVAMPKDSYMPVVGDKYAVFGIALPDAYVCDDATKSGASWDMFKEAARYMYENEEPRFSFTGELDGIWAKKNWLNIGGRIKLGGYVLFSDPQFHPDGVGIRIVGIKDYINNPHSPEIELSNSVVGSSIMSEIRKIESNEVLTDSQHKEALQFTNRRFWDAQQTITALEEAVEANFSSFSDSINPIAVQTMSMLVGDESLQFCFVRSLASTTEVAHNVTYDQTTKQLAIPGGFLQHKTLGIESVSSGHSASEYKTWSMPSYLSAVLTAAEQKYYAYAKVGRQTQGGAFILSAKPIPTEGVDGYYHLLLGVLNSEFEGERSYVSLHGYTEILPGRITTNKIVSADGKTYFDLAQGHIGGCISFGSGSGGLGNLTEWPEVEGNINNARATANAAQQQIQATNDYIEVLNSDVNAELLAVNKRLDGVVDSYFEIYDPSLNNYPANEWVTDKEKENHVGDTFTNKKTGNSWKWKIINSIWSWDEITDTLEKELLKKIATAQDTADGKRRNFVFTPSTPYDVGDTWSQGSGGDYMRCVKSRASGAFVAADWDKGSKYTDDSAVDNLQIGGANRIFSSRYDSFKQVSDSLDWEREIVTDAKFGKVIQLQRVASNGDFQSNHQKVQLTDQQIVFAVIAKQIGTGGSWYFGGWTETYTNLSSDSSTIDLGDGWKLYWSTFRSGTSINSYGAFGINSMMGKWQFYACAMYAGNRPSSDWSPAPEDVAVEIEKAQAEADAAAAAISAMNDDGVFDVVEKQSIRTQWELISNNTTHTDAGENGSYKKTLVLAGSNVSTTDLTFCYDALKTNLNNNELYANTNKLNFDRTVMAAAFAAYYNEEVDVLDKVAKRYVDDQAFSDINLLDNSYPSVPFTGNADKYVINYWGQGDNMYIKAGKTYTITAELMVDEAFSQVADAGITFFIRGMAYAGVQSYNPVTYTVVQHTFTATISGVLDAYHIPKFSAGNSYIKWVKLTEGNRSSLTWNPSLNAVNETIATAQTAANAANTAVSGLNTYVDGAFKDGVINTAEAKAIGEQIKSIEESFAKLEGNYYILINYPLIPSDIKAEADTAMANLNDSYTLLISTINDIIAASIVTPADRNRYNRYYASYTLYAFTLESSLTTVNKSIFDVIDVTANGALQAARNEEQARIAALNTVNTTLGSLQNQVDGVVENWFYEPAPLATNIPASTWTTVAIKRNHVGDTYTSIAQAPAAQAGKSWRWVENPAGTFLWTPISDSDAVKALQQAAKAQSTADGKSTTFLVRPSNYRIGDMWILAVDSTVNAINYKKGEVLTANANSVAYVQSHWSKQVRYTDDAVALAAQIAANNLVYLGNAFKNDNTVVYGGLAVSSFMGVKDTTGAVVAGMAGKNFLADGAPNFTENDTSCPMLFAGATSATTANSAKFRVYPNGKVIASEFTADVGCKVGGFDVSAEVSGFGGLSYNHPDGGYMRWFNQRFEMGDPVNGYHTGMYAVSGYMMNLTSSKAQYTGGISIDVHRNAAAIDLKKGYIKGFRLNTRRLYQSSDLLDDGDCVVVAAKKAATIRLPSSPLPGQVYRIIKDSAFDLSINGSGILINRLGGLVAQTIPISSSWLGEINLVHVSDATDTKWYMTTL